MKMPELNEVLGTKVFEYESVAEFGDSIRTILPKRLHTFFSNGLFGIGANWTAAFLDSNEMVHGYRTESVEEGFKETVKPLYDQIKIADIKEVDGRIKVSNRNGSVYQLFQTDAPSVEERVQASHDAWIEAVRSLPKEGTLIQYLREDSTVVLDATHGKSHLITSLDGENGRTLEETLTRLQSFGTNKGDEILSKPYATKDNGPVIGWYLDMINK